ncbi:hypothetical protein H4696_009766 [Amycolatopsis lexingtonensis]|uniref:Uncharacterized protein n=1 Tax=Amycolatopsis lexingtonensis TaxID=218822 RepID=A0ABR9IHM4_9PSEU|nr:hypothetical protein [Amycolatopsis lexingtonensis]MBE1502666.1 hypothetical protein [Amycolatopsis lexingtonensis]
MRATYTFTVPKVDLADFNPGHGTNTVRQEAGWLRQTYGVSVRTRVIGNDVEFFVSGKARAIDDIWNLMNT